MSRSRTRQFGKSNLLLASRRVAGKSKIPGDIGGRRGGVISTEMDGCHTLLLLSIAAQGALDVVLDAKDTAWDVRALKVRVPLHTIGVHLAVRVDVWHQTRTIESLVKSVQTEHDDLLTDLTQAMQRTESTELCFDQLDD